MNPFHSLIDGTLAVGDALTAAGAAFSYTLVKSYHERTVERAKQAGIRMAMREAEKGPRPVVMEVPKGPMPEGIITPKQEASAAKKPTNGRRTRSIRAARA